jgi:hypothetical protein
MKHKEKRKDCPYCGLPLRLRKLPPVRRRRDKFWSHVAPGSAAICRLQRKMARHNAFSSAWESLRAQVEKIRS